MLRINSVPESFAKFPSKYLCQSLLSKKYWLLFSCDLWQVFKSTYFKELLQVAVNNDSK